MKYGVFVVLIVAIAAGSLWAHHSTTAVFDMGKKVQVSGTLNRVEWINPHISIYVDAKTSYIEEWYVDRFRKLRTTAFAQPESYFHRYASLSDDEAESTARDIWKRINEPNLEENVLPTRGRAQLVLTKDSDHTIRRMLLRKV